ncbi:hypothetical protein [Pseudomonas sp. NFX15]|uniref:hypothetical protein n=1 Tax=Pseudomonas sp. NFX15 TaxID=2816958 RepID=UPI003B8AB933
MQTDNAKQGSVLKKIAGWTFSAFAAWAITKIFDSYYDLSLFSSAYAAVGEWLGQTIPVQQWLFWLVFGAAPLAIALGLWSYWDRRLVVAVAKAEEEKAYKSARDSVEKAKTASKESEVAKQELKVMRKKLEAIDSELAAANAKIADLQTPKVQPLNEQQRLVLAAIAYYDNTDEECYVKSLSQRIKLTMVETEGAVDVLLKRNLVADFYANTGRGVFLSPDGRAYVLSPDFDMSHLPL